jgi:hypothetical protein
LGTDVGVSAAKNFLIERIVVEAQSEGVKLSEIERKMLYFTESAEVLPDMAEVSSEFDRTLTSKTLKRRYLPSFATSSGKPKGRAAMNVLRGMMLFSGWPERITTCW